MINHNAWDAFAHLWFPVVLILVIFLLVRERAHLREQWRQLQELDDLSKAWEKAFTDQRERMERHFSNLLDELRRASNVIWIRTELHDEEQDNDDDPNPKRKAARH